MILAIDTSGNNCCVALWRDGIIGLRESKSELRHNEVLLDQIKSLLSDQDIQGNSVSAVAVSSGPGSFTGLRVGMATAKGLCWSWNIPFIAIPTLEGLAAAVPPGTKRVLTLMPARACEVYWALFEYNTSGWKQLEEDQVSEVSQLGEACQGKVFLFGEGYLKHREELDQIFAGRSLILSDTEKTEILAVSTARLAAERFARGEYDDLMQTEPKYCYAFPRKKS